VSYIIHLIIYFCIFAIVALSLNVCVGYSGRFTLAHGAYFGVGAYVYAILTTAYGWNSFLSILAAALVGTALSLLLSIPAIRLRRDFFVMHSLAVQALLFSALYNWRSHDAPLGSWRNLTNGPFGIARIPSPTIIGIQLTSLKAFGYIALLVGCACGATAWLLTSSPWGRLLIAVRDDEIVARALGKNTWMIGAQAFAAACGMAAIGGALYAMYVGYVDPSLASLDQSVLMLSMVIVGGTGNFIGPLVGTAVLLLIPELLWLTRVPGPLAANLRLLAYGGLLVLVVRIRPQGIAGTFRVE